MSFAHEYQQRISGKFTDIRFHLPMLRLLACSFDSPRILEIGVRDGNSTVTFLSAIEEKQGGYLWSVDINEPEIPEHTRKRWAKSGHWSFIKGDSTRLPMECFPPEVDIVFLDGSHLAYDTIMELRRFVPLVVEGGLVLSHDCEWGTREMRATLDPWAYGPVAWAFDVYCGEEGYAIPESGRKWWSQYPGSHGLARLDVINKKFRPEVPGMYVPVPVEDDDGADAS